MSERGLPPHRHMAIFAKLLSFAEKRILDSKVFGEADVIRIGTGAAPQRLEGTPHPRLSKAALLSGQEGRPEQTESKRGALGAVGAHVGGYPLARGCVWPSCATRRLATRSAAARARPKHHTGPGAKTSAEVGVPSVRGGRAWSGCDVERAGRGGFHPCPVEAGQCRWVQGGTSATAAGRDGRFCERSHRRT